MGQVLSYIFCIVKKCLCRLEQKKDSDDKKKHSSLPISTPEFLHENVTTACITITEERSQDSASARLGCGKCEKTKNGGLYDRKKHSGLPISTPKVLGVEKTKNGGLYDRKKHSRLPISTPKVLGVEKTKNGGSDDRSKHSSLPISTPKLLKSLIDTNSASASAHVTRNEGPERRVRHYCSSHKMLVGERDFSFSASLAVAFGSAKKMVATSLDSKR